MLEKYYLSDSPNSNPLQDGIKYIKSAKDVVSLHNALIYCDSAKIIKDLRDMDEHGIIHFGCRGISAKMMYDAKVIRFDDNYLISSNKWKEKKYQIFKTFVPKDPIKLCETNYICITDYTDEEVSKLFTEQMDSIIESPQLGIDFETNDFPEMKGHFPLGLSIVNKEKGFYYDFDDYLTTKDTYPIFFKTLLDFVSENCFKLYAFNVSFEIRCFYGMYKRFIKLQDTRAWCIIDAMKNNLKYAAQYYLEVKSWDDSVSEEQRLLKKSFEINLDEFKREYKLGENSKYEVIRKLYNINRDNPKFISRYEKFHGSVWACSNQKEVGKYCCYDSVMDIHIYEAIRKIKHVDHYYNNECYYVYLFNQYLSAIIELSGIDVDWKRMMYQKDMYEKIIFNSNLYINKELMKYKIAKLEKQSNIELELNEKVRYLVEDLNTYLFVTSDPIKLGKNFAAKVRKNPEAFNHLVELYNDELQFIITEWSNDEAWKKVSRSRKIFEGIGKKLMKEWNLASLFEQFNHKYEEIYHCNERALKYWSGTPEELNELMNKGSDVWHKEVPKEFWDEVKLYIWDYKMLRYADNLKGSMELRRCKPIYDRMVNACKGRDLFTPVNKELSKYFIWEMNSPDHKEWAGEILQDYYEDDVALFRAFKGLCKSVGKMEMFNKEQYLKYHDQMLKKFKDLSKIPEFYDYYWKSVEIMETKQILNKAKNDGSMRKIKVGTGEFKDKRIKWSLKSPARGTMHMPFSIPVPTRTDHFGEGLKEHFHEINNYSIDEDFDIKIWNLHKFLGIFKLNRVAVKIQSTSIEAILSDSCYVDTIDESHGRRYRRRVEDDKMEIRYYTKTHANACRTNRWKSNVHSVFPATEDSRIPLVPKIGTHFILPRNNEQEYENSNQIITVDGLNFRYSDKVFTKNGPKFAYQLNETDEFDPDWIKKIKEDDKKITGDVNW